MTSLIFIGLLGIMIVIVFKRKIVTLFDQHALVYKLSEARWFQNPWRAGLFLFFMNVALFTFTCTALYALSFFLIPFVHLFIMIGAVIASIILWGFVYQAWNGTNRGRLLVGAFGSSFYMILTVLFIYRFIRLQPAYPGEDTFMAGLGLLFATLVTTVAFISCFIYTGFSKMMVKSEES